jgi:hypothetical protein
VLVLLAVGGAAEVGAWGASGHRWITAIAVAQLPGEIPLFARAPQAVAEYGELGRELDRSKGAGRTHDAERDPGHYVGLDDAGRVGGAIALDALPPTREEYDTQLRRARLTQYQVGYLPYSIVDGWQQIRKDFALWRVAAFGARAAADPADRAWFEEDRRLRETLARRDIGVWSHYVADASQPMHVTIHFNGWGNYPNPRGFSPATTLHAWVEGEFVRRFVTADRVAAAVRPYRDCQCPIEERTRKYLETTWTMVVPLYELERAGGFAEGDRRGADFLIQRLAAGAGEVRDMIVDAWRASAEAMVGYPEVNVRDIESGKIPLRRGPFVGED